MIDFLSFLPAKRKVTPSGWISVNAPCCIHRGQNQDKRMRGGFKPGTDNSWSWHCFNCGFTASFFPGRILGFKARSLLSWLGADDTILDRINLESLQYRSIHGLTHSKIEKYAIEFEDQDLPPDLENIDEENPAHAPYIAFLKDRCIDPTAYPYMVSPDATGRAAKRIVIPFSHNYQIVGHSSRMFDGKIPKYLSSTQPGYVFGIDLQKDTWNTAIVVEGVFDALSINGLAVLHNDINPAQKELIESLNRNVIVVPDIDSAGMTLVARAIEFGWGVSFPNWADGVKDVNDAIIKYGRLGTLLTILDTAETNIIKIEMRRKNFVKRIHK